MRILSFFRHTILKVCTFNLKLTYRFFNHTMKVFLRILPLIAFLLVFSQCNSEDDTPDIDTPDYSVELLTQNGETGDPLEGANIQLNDDGKIVTTQADGLEVFNENDLDAVDGQNSGDSVIYSFSISHPDFQSIELEAGLGDTTVNMEPLEGYSRNKIW